ncbi:MAG: sigma factor-like helix-turn-helix DNA-binding protein [Gemmatimonadota bacterium]|nr:sigma factor-like helix-turn-helix DNA-binding protein [Gemmatimonadota bacterium]
MDDPELEALAAAAMHASAATAGLEDVFERFDLRDAVQREVLALSLTMREVVVLVDLEDWSCESTATALGIPIGTVTSRLFRGRRVLQERLLAHARDAGIIGQADQTQGG